MKIAVVALLAGLMLTVAILAAVTPARQRPIMAGAVPETAYDQAQLEHCRAAVTADEACTKVWAERRCRFFGENRTAK